MRLYSSQRGRECVMVATYNLFRFLNLRVARGGYAHNRAWLAKMCQYDPKHGCDGVGVMHAAALGLRGSEYELVQRRNSWENVRKQLQAVKEGPAVGIVSYDAELLTDHCVLVWRVGPGSSIYTTNSPTGTGTRAIYFYNYMLRAHPMKFGVTHKVTMFWQAQLIKGGI